MHKLFHSGWHIAICLALALLGAVWMALESDFDGIFRPLSGPNGLLYDAATGLAGPLKPTVAWQDVAVVLVDRATLTSPAWSGTPRPLQQPQLGKLGTDLLDLGASKVGYDLVFALDPSALRLPIYVPPDYDAPLDRLLHDHSEDVVLGADAAISPAPRYADMAATGVIDLQTETDGTVRSFATRVRRGDGERAPGFAEALGQLMGMAPSRVGRAFLAPSSSLLDIPHLSAKSIEDCLVSKDGRKGLALLMAGRTVIVGAGLDGEDEHEGPDRFLRSSRQGVGLPTCARREPSIGRSVGRVPGAFLQAAAVEGMLRNPIALASVWARIALDVAIVGIGAFLTFVIGKVAKIPERRGPLLGTTLASAVTLFFALTLVTVVMTITAAVGLLEGIWLPIATPVVLASVCCAIIVLGSALRRDIALADLRVAFGHFLPPVVIEATLGRDKNALRGAAREITVLMADLNGFTDFCSTRGSHPEFIVDAINERFSVAQAAIDLHGGAVDKFVGDAVIAIWNGIESQEDHTLRAVAAAVDIVYGDPGRPDGALKFKCGVATGLAFVGRYGAEGKGSFSAIGEPMNLAARLVTLCHPNMVGVIVAKGTAAAIGSIGADSFRFSLRRLGLAALKGFADPVEFYAAEPRPQSQTFFPLNTKHGERGEELEA